MRRMGLDARPTRNWPLEERGEAIIWVDGNEFRLGLFVFGPFIIKQGNMDNEHVKI